MHLADTPRDKVAAFVVVTDEGREVKVNNAELELLFASKAIMVPQAAAATKYWTTVVEGPIMKRNL